ncbi:histone H4 [Purpureocillium lavendulum]|uniref:Histone H4 n=1 Tax=Purpureocillium lavendulum TaxID=1247861 RepID=A0AB34FN54_9HYPO|nr:histone H4 [Purpureocillium lavendulum]
MASTRPHHEEVDGEPSSLSKAHSRDEAHAAFSWDSFSSGHQHYESLGSDSNTVDLALQDPLPVLPPDLSMEEFLQLCEEAYSITAERRVILVDGNAYALAGDDGDCVDLTEPLMDILVVSNQAYRVVDLAGDWWVDLTQPLENVVVVNGAAVARRQASRHNGKVM